MPRRAMRLRLLVVAVAALALCPRAGHAELLEAELTVLGMTCPFCAFGVEKKLRAVPGVEEVGVQLDLGLIRVSFAPRSAATPTDLAAAVKKAGFSLSALRLSVRGTIAQGSGRAVLDAGEGGRFSLFEARGGEKVPLSPERAASLIRKGVATVRGSVRGWDGAEPQLVLDAHE